MDKRTRTPQAPRAWMVWLTLGTVALGGWLIATMRPQDRPQALASSQANLSSATPIAEPPIVAQANTPTAQPMPEFQGIQTWLNSQPLTLANLKGRPALIQFWTLACINCQRTLPYVTRWHQQYSPQGLQVIGIHTPEFAFEREVNAVQRAMQKYGIAYPVAIDNQYKTWEAYSNQYWPHLFLVDRQGRIRYDHIGEGNYAETEAKIRQLLAEGSS